MLVALEYATPALLSAVDLPGPVSYLLGWLAALGIGVGILVWIARDGRRPG